jgi:hypothetical protein
VYEYCLATGRQLPGDRAGGVARHALHQDLAQVILDDDRDRAAAEIQQVVLLEDAAGR